MASPWYCSLEDDTLFLFTLLKQECVVWKDNNNRSNPVSIRAYVVLSSEDLYYLP